MNNLFIIIQWKTLKNLTNTGLYYMNEQKMLLTIWWNCIGWI